MNVRICVDCGVEIPVRRKRCPECQHALQLQYQRDWQRRQRHSDPNHYHRPMRDGMKFCYQCQTWQTADEDHFYYANGKPQTPCRMCRGHSMRMKGLRRCVDCKQTFPATEEYFHKNKSQYLGLLRRCKDCNREQAKKYYHTKGRKQEKQEKQELS